MNKTTKVGLFSQPMYELEGIKNIVVYWLKISFIDDIERGTKYRIEQEIKKCFESPTPENMTELLNTINKDGVMYRISFVPVFIKRAKELFANEKHPYLRAIKDDLCLFKSFMYLWIQNVNAILFVHIPCRIKVKVLKALIYLKTGEHV